MTDVDPCLNWTPACPNQPTVSCSHRSLSHGCTRARRDPRVVPYSTAEETDARRVRTCSRSLPDAIQGQGSCLTGWALPSAVGPPDRSGAQGFPRLHPNMLEGLWQAELGVQTSGSSGPQRPPNQREPEALPCAAASS